MFLAGWPSRDYEALSREWNAIRTALVKSGTNCLIAGVLAGASGRAALIVVIDRVKSTAPDLMLNHGFDRIQHERCSSRDARRVLFKALAHHASLPHDLPSEKHRIYQTNALDPRITGDWERMGYERGNALNVRARFKRDGWREDVHGDLHPPVEFAIRTGF